MNIRATYAQQKIWAEAQLSDTKDMHNLHYVFKINGNLNEEKFLWVIQFLTQRHEELRASFKYDKDKLWQVIGSLNKDVITYKDLTQEFISKKKQEERIDIIIEQEITQEFKLTKSPLFSILILKTEENNWITIFVFHHIIFDGHSAKVFFNELSQLYNKGQIDSVAEPPKAKMMMQHYVIDEQKKTNQYRSLKATKYWEKALQNHANLVLDINTKKQKYEKNLRRLNFHLSKKTSNRIKTFVKQYKTTTFLFITTAFSTLLHRYSQTSQFSITYSRNLRPEEYNDYIGFFVNTPFFNIKLNPNHNFLTLLNKITYNRQKNRPFEDFPIKTTLLNKASNHKTSSINISATNFGEIKLNGLNVKRLEVPSLVRHNDIILRYDNNSDKFLFSLDCKQAIPELPTAKAFIKHFVNLIQEILESPTTKIMDFGFLQHREYANILYKWNNTDTPLPKTTALDKLFEEIAKKTPNKIAISTEKKSLTYKQLNEKTNQLAHFLRNIYGDKKPSSNNNSIIISMHKGLELIIAILGTLKSGGTYIPLDTNLPSERLNFIANDSQSDILITTSEINFPKFNRITKIINLDSEMKHIETLSKENLRTTNNANDIAYIIYTSGTTGYPKGVLIKHISVINLALAEIKAFTLNKKTKTLSFSSISFDAFIWETFATLFAGGELILYKKESLTPGTKLSKTIKMAKPTFLTLPPVALQNTYISHIKTLVSAGDTLSKALLQKVLSHNDLINAYGPTENTVCTTIKKYRKNSNECDVFIGKPIDNVKTYVLDKHKKLLPIGVPGELYVTGHNLAKGYLNNRSLTKQKFINNPLDHNGSSKLYATGDIVRWTYNGNLDFIGRNDSQVKIRGFRIELLEIEAILKNHPSISDAVVLVRKDQYQTPYLVAYISPPPLHLNLAQLREYLISYLPEYMIPEQFVFLKQFPITFNGKIDKKTLIDTQQKNIVTNSQPKKTASSIELQIANIIKQTLGVHTIDLENNFFEMGLHSFMLINLCDLLNKNLTLELSPVDIFSYPTIQSLAQYICSIEKKQDGNHLIDHQKIALKKQKYKKRRVSHASLRKS